jgi:hypothetical protein
MHPSGPCRGHKWLHCARCCHLSPRQWLDNDFSSLSCLVRLTYNYKYKYLITYCTVSFSLHNEIYRVHTLCVEVHIDIDPRKCINHRVEIMHIRKVTNSSDLAGSGKLQSVKSSPKSAKFSPNSRRSRSSQFWTHSYFPRPRSGMLEISKFDDEVQSINIIKIPLIAHFWGWIHARTIRNLSGSCNTPRSEQSTSLPSC